MEHAYIGDFAGIQVFVWCDVAGSQMSALHALVGFMASLTNADADGRILLDPAAGTLKFLLLNAAAHFSKVRFFWSMGALPGLP